MTRSLRSDDDRPETIEETSELLTNAAGATTFATRKAHIDVLVNDIWGAEVLRGGPSEWNKPRFVDVPDVRRRGSV